MRHDLSVLSASPVSSDARLALRALLPGIVGTAMLRFALSDSLLP